MVHLAEILAGQFDAALYMLDRSLRVATDADWDANVGTAPLRRVAYHVLFYVDYYLSPGDAAFSLRDLHAEGGDERGDDPSPGLSREATLAYLATCRAKMHGQLAAETEESLRADCGFPRRTFCRAEMYVYNLRHLQHHTGGIQAYLRRTHPGIARTQEIPWRGKGWP